MTTAIREAASVLLAASPGSAEVLVVRRAEKLRFFGGFLAFPGGKVSASDAPETSPEADTARTLRIRRLTAARELFEETGVLLARGRDGSFPPFGSELEQLRRDLLADRVSFTEVLARMDLAVRESDLVLIGEIITPAFSPQRYATTFFLACLPPSQQVVLWPGELDEAFWSSAAAVLDRWERGECLVSPPTVMILEAIRGRPADEAPARLEPLLRSLADGAIHPIYFAPQVRMIPLLTPSLPPANYTNAYLVGSGPVYLLDPGAVDAAEQQRLFDVLDSPREAGRGLTAIVLTHHHPDHVGAAAACAERYGIPIWAHPLTARALQGRVRVDRVLADGDRLPLGTAPDGSPWHLEALHTPGHASGHLAFYEPHYRLLFVGDMVSMVSSVVIAPPDGDLAVYLASLRRLREVPCRLLLPGHGSASARPQEAIDECLKHRAKREEMLLAALGTMPRSAKDLTEELYKGVPPSLWRFAELQLLAGLQKLQREGRVEQDSEGWRLPAHQ